jgi:hypothetical protein
MGFDRYREPAGELASLRSGGLWVGSVGGERLG